MTDHGGKFTSHEFTNHLQTNGITHQFSCSHTSEQNGIAERKNRHILENARTLLHHASLPNKFWLEAASTAVYLINRLATKTLHMLSPYHKLYQKTPSLLHLKTFNCLCYPWSVYTRNHKLDPKSSSCIFLGYFTDHKGLCCYNLTTTRLIISRHVRFHEHEFPMATTLIPTPPPQISIIHNPLSPTFSPSPSVSAPSSPRPPTLPPTPPTTITTLAASPPPTKDIHFQYQRRKTKPTPPPPTKTSLPTPPNSPFPPQTAHPTLTKPTNQPTSTHPMQTRSKQTTPTTTLNLSLTTTDPLTYNQASSNPNSQQAMATKISDLQNKHTWDLVPK